MLWLDAFTANVDRSWRNPNLLVWHGDLWVIDHGASLYFHHAWGGGALLKDGAAERFANQPWSPDDHVLLASATGPRRPPTRRSARCSTRTSSPRCCAEVPDEWLEPVPGAETPDAVRAAYVALPDRPARRPGSGCPRWRPR